MDRIGFIGVGQMGRWMTEHLLEKGYQVSVYDKDEKASANLTKHGARVSASVGELGRDSDVVITMLPNSQIVESVLEDQGGLLENMKPGSIIADMSSSYVFSTRRLATKALVQGITLIDAPVSGGVKGAKEATLTIMVGGSEEAYQRVLPILQCLGRAINRVGDSGAGHALKALNNFLSAASLYATTEAMVLAKSLGLDLTAALETINKSSGQSFSTHYKFPSFVIPRRFNSGFALELLLKDVKMVTSIARDSGVPVLLAGLVEQVYQAAQLSSENKKPDHTEVAKYLEKLTGIIIE